MPGGRSSKKPPTMAPSSARAESSGTAAQGSRRSTRSRSSITTPYDGQPGPSTIARETQVPAKMAPRTRAPRASSASTSLAGRSLRGRAAESSLTGSGSSSSVPTSLAISSESNYSTPDTSKLPSPDASESSKTQQEGGRCFFEIHIPAQRRAQEAFDAERASHSSIYSMKAKGKRPMTEIGDSEEDYDQDLDSPDTSHDAEVARRLQNEEYMDEDSPSSGGSLGITRRPAKQPKYIARRPLGKKRRIVADSEDSENSDADMEDANPSESDLPFAEADEEEVELSSEDEIPVKTRPMPKVKAPLPNYSLSFLDIPDSDLEDDFSESSIGTSSDSDSSAPSDDEPVAEATTAEVPAPIGSSRAVQSISAHRRGYRRQNRRRMSTERNRLEENHPELKTMWTDLEKMPVLKTGMAQQPQSISRQLKPFQLEGLAWMLEMEKTEWKGGLLGDEMGLGKTIQAVSLIMSDYPAKQPSLVLVPPVALMQWQSEISSYTDGTLKTFVFHGTNKESKNITVKDLKKYDVIMMSYNSLESMYRRQEKGFKRANGIHKQRSVIHSIKFHRAILDEAHCIKTRTTMTAKACFALKTEYRWCLTGTPLQNRIGELFSLVRFLNIRPFTSYLCKQCPCTTIEWSMNQDSRCSSCGHIGMQHVSLFNRELLNPIQKFGNIGPGYRAFQKLRLMTDRIMLRRLKRDHTDSMELPVKEIYVDRQFFGEEENDLANSIMTNGQRKFDTYVAQGVLLNNYANIFGLIMQMRQVADHPDLILKKNAEGGQNVLVCCICDEPAEDTVRSRCKHDFCRTCVSAYVRSTDDPDCPRCHIPLVIDLEQPEIEQDEALVKKSSIINRIKMENWTSSSKIELLVHELHKLRSDNASHKSIIFSQFTTMLQLIEWRLRRAGITTVMLDGSMTPAQRQASIDHFMSNVDVECFLVSLKAGGVALNLTEASRVFIVDPWWNPAAEWQSADRCHRIGQTRPCTITRLCIEDSVESRMVLIQEKKTSMIHSTVNADDKAMDTLSPEDMQFLFRGH